jgi:hypothetical protein
MDLLTAYAIWATGAILLVGTFAARVPQEDVGIVFFLAVVWPLSVPAILFMCALTFVGWEMDLAKGTKMFGARKSTNPAVKGFAFTVFKQEFQFFKVR